MEYREPALLPPPVTPPPPPPRILPSPLLPLTTPPSPLLTPHRVFGWAHPQFPLRQVGIEALLPTTPTARVDSQAGTGNWDLGTQDRQWTPCSTTFRHLPHSASLRTLGPSLPRTRTSPNGPAEGTDHLDPKTRGPQRESLEGVEPYSAKVRAYGRVEPAGPGPLICTHPFTHTPLACYLFLYIRKQL